MPFLAVPAVWAGISAATAVIGAGVSAYGMIQQGKAQNAAAQYQAKVDENNAISQGYAAAAANRDANAEADQIAEQRRRVLATNQVSAAASGVQLNGSFIDTQVDTATGFEKDMAMAKYRGNLKAYNLRQGAADNYSQAAFSRASGSNAMRSASWGAGGSILSGLSSAANIGFQATK